MIKTLHVVLWSAYCATSCIFCNRLSAVLPEDPSNKHCRLFSVVGLSQRWPW